MKRCKICKEEKSLDEFPLHSKKNNTYRAECKKCYNEKRKQRRVEDEEYRARVKQNSKKSYEKNKKRRIHEVTEYRKNNKQKVAKWSKTYREKLKKEFEEFKATLKCERCDENHPACLDFHHLDPKEKDGNISQMRFAKLKLQKELEKCIVLCANCHRKEHYINN